MNRYKTIRCNLCGLPQYITGDQKTRKCPRCKKTIDVTKCLVLYVGYNVYEALRVLQYHKLQDALKRWKI